MTDEVTTVSEIDPRASYIKPADAKSSVSELVERITPEMIEAAARALCRVGTNFPTPEQTLAWVDEKWPRFKEEAELAVAAAFPSLLSALADAERDRDELRKSVESHLKWFERFICNEDELNSSTPRKVAQNAQDAAAELRDTLRALASIKGGE